MFGIPSIDSSVFRVRGECTTYYASKVVIEEIKALSSSIIFRWSSKCSNSEGDWKEGYLGWVLMPTLIP